MIVPVPVKYFSVSLIIHISSTQGNLFSLKVSSQSGG